GRSVGEVFRVVFAVADLALAGLDHGGRGEKPAVDEFGDVAFADQPAQVHVEFVQAGLVLGGERGSRLGGLLAFGGRGAGRLLQAEVFGGQFALANHRMRLDEADEFADAVGEDLAGRAEFALHGADVADALGAFFEDGEAFATEASAQGVGGVERELLLAFELTFDGAADFAGGQGVEQASGDAEGLDRAHDLTAGVLQQVGAGGFDRGEGRGVGGRGGLGRDFGDFGSFRRRGGFGGFRRRGGFRYFRRGGGLRGLGGFVDRGSCGVGRGFHGGFRRPGFF